MVRYNKSKHYKKFVFSAVYKAISEAVGCTKTEAVSLLTNALAYNTVLEEIIDKAKMVYEKEEEKV